MNELSMKTSQLEPNAELAHRIATKSTRLNNLTKTNTEFPIKRGDNTNHSANSRSSKRSNLPGIGIPSVDDHQSSIEDFSGVPKVKFFT